MEKKTTNELDRLQGHCLSLVAGGIVLPFESDSVICQRNQSPVGDCNAVGVAGQILENLLWPSEGGFGVNYPFQMTGLLTQSLKGRWLGQRLQFAVEL